MYEWSFLWNIIYFTLRKWVIFCVKTRPCYIPSLLYYSQQIQRIDSLVGVPIHTTSQSFWKNFEHRLYLWTIWRRNHSWVDTKSHQIVSFQSYSGPDSDDDGQKFTMFYMIFSLTHWHSDWRRSCQIVIVIQLANNTTTWRNGTWMLRI